MSTEGFLCFGGVAILVVVVTIVSMIRVVREYERLVVFRFGRCIGTKGPGLVFLFPLIDRPITADLREQFLEIPHQTSITKDNAPIGVDFLIYWKVVNPELSILQVGDFRRASIGIATTTLRAVIGDIVLDDVLAQREHINQVLRVKLDDVTERWGVKVTSVEIREIEPPKEVQVAMNRQMSAERNRRATVTEANGQSEASIKVAEGEKQAAILRAEGDKQSNILRAEGDRASQALRAEGYAVALQYISEAASKVDANTMTLQYLETLKQLGAGPATKFIFPLEFTSLLNLRGGPTKTT
jgi:regulator of protease activity HflC (stomatin/prohibitin superfamily)